MKRQLSVLLTLALVLSLIPAAAVPEVEAAELLPAQEWKQGSYYATLNPNVTIRRYTVIPCQEGEVYTLNFPSDNWAVYAHLADAQGDFGKEYLLRNGKPLDIVVKEMDGRIPTEIRLTTYNYTDNNMVLNDENFASFDVTIQKSSKVKGDLLWEATWNQGTPANPTTALRKHTEIPCQVGDTFRFGLTSTYWDVYVLPADENGPLTEDDTYFSKDGTFTVAPVDGINPTSIIVVAVPDPQGTSITDLIWDSFSVSCVKEGDTFTFATQNFGLWNDGMTQGVAADKVEARAAAWQAEMAEHDIDILVGQEWLPYLDSDKTVDANNKVFGSMYPYMYGNHTATYDGKNIISRTPLTDITYSAMVSNVGRRYAKAYTTINGKKVCIINAHLSFEEDININRKEEIVELLNIAQTEPYVIIAGDFNVFTPDEFQIFEEAGYSLANAGAFGEFNTWPNLGRNPTREVNRVLDNIIVGPGIKINSVQADDHQLSDHALLVAELELLEEGAFTDNRLMCEHCDLFVEWTPWALTTGGSANAIVDSGHYYLTGDLSSVSGAFFIGVADEATPDVVIDLRGHAVKATSRAFYVRKNSKLTIVDTVGCGTVTTSCTSTGGAAYVAGGATFTWHDGALIATDTTTAKKGGAIYLENGATLNIKGGEIHGSYGIDGGAICGYNNVINLEAGTVYGSQVTGSGGAIHMSSGTLNMTGGTIYGGSASGNGGTIYANRSTLNLTGGNISGGAGSYGGNIYATNNATVGSLNLGFCTITGGTATSAGPDIYLSADGKLKVLKTFAGTSHIAVNAAHLPNQAPGAALNTSLDSAEGYFPGKLILDSISTKPQLCGAEGETSLYIASAALVDAQNNLTWYAHNKSAVENYGDSTYLLPAAGELSLAGGSYTVDLAGQTVNITGTGSVTCFDSANDTFETFGTATIDGVTLMNEGIVSVAGKDYCTVNDKGTYSFHRLTMGISSVSVRPSITGIYYRGTWQMDDTLAAKVKSFGVAVSVVDMPDESFMSTDPDTLWTKFDSSALESGKPITSVMISGILKDSAADNDSRGRTEIYAATYMVLDDGTQDGLLLVSNKEVKYSLYDVMKLLDENAYDANSEALENFYADWTDPMADWGFTNIGKKEST